MSDNENVSQDENDNAVPAQDEADTEGHILYGAKDDQSDDTEGHRQAPYN